MPPESEKAERMPQKKKVRFDKEVDVAPQHHDNRQKSLQKRAKRTLNTVLQDLHFINTMMEKAKDDEPKDRMANVPREYHKFQKVFQEELETGLPLNTEWDHEIELKDGKNPTFHKIYNLDQNELKTLREWIDDQLRKGYIRPSKSSAGYPVMFVPKKNGKLRLVIDYRKLNEITKKDVTPLPLITEIRDRLFRAKWFTALDLKGAYNLIRIKPGDEWKTAFRTRYGLFECLVMPFGLTNAPATFQKMINHVLKEFIDLFVIVYLDDILIFSETLEEHKKHVALVLETLEKANLLVEPEKCQFHQQKVVFLGHVITPGEVRMDPEKLKAISEWQPPKNVKEVQSFLGLANYYRRFIRNFSKIATPLTELTKKERKFLWAPDVQEAFDTLKKALISNPVLVMFDPEKPITIEVDASDYAIGGVLSQPDENGKLRPVAYFSEKLHGPELRYPIYDKEFKAIYTALDKKHWRNYCQGSKFPVTILTDHRNITYFTTTQELSQRQVRYYERLSEFNLIIKHCKGTENGRADALSRRPDHFQEIPDLQAQVLQHDKDGNLVLKTLNTMFTIEEDDPIIDDIKEHVKDWTEEQFPDGTSTEKGYPTIDGLIWVPDELQKKVVKTIHAHPIHGHRGIRKTTQQVQRYYKFDGIKKTVQKVVSECITCGRAKAGRHLPYGKLQPLQVPTRPWESISFDHIVKLPPSKEPMTGKTWDSIFVIVDRLTKMSYFIPAKESSTAEDLAYWFQRHIYANHGLPNEIISDRGSTFVSKFWQSLMARLGLNHKVSTAYHPQTDGQTERINQIIETYLRCYVNFEQNDWVEHLPTAQISYNGTPVESTGKSPFYANYGFEPEAFRPPRQGENAEKAIIAADQLKALHDEMRTQLEFIRERMSKYADQRRIEGPILQEGDMVYLLRHTRGEKQPNIKTNRPSDKLDFKKLGPYKVLKQIREVNYELDLPIKEGQRGRSVHNIFHISLLEKAVVDEETGEIIHDEITIEGEELEYEVERILQIKFDEETQQPKYLVKWKNYDEADNTWEPIEHLGHSKALVDDFHRQLNLQRSTRKDPTRTGTSRQGQRKKPGHRNLSD